MSPINFDKFLILWYSTSNDTQTINNVYDDDFPSGGIVVV